MREMIKFKSVYNFLVRDRNSSHMWWYIVKFTNVGLPIIPVKPANADCPKVFHQVYVWQRITTYSIFKTSHEVTRYITYTEKVSEDFCDHLVSLNADDPRESNKSHIKSPSNLKKISGKTQSQQQFIRKIFCFVFLL